MFQLHEIDNGYDIEVANASVEMLSLAWQLSALISDDVPDRMYLSAGTRFEWIAPGRPPVTVDPEASSVQLGELVVALRHDDLLSITIRKGTLTADFAKAGRLVIPPNPQFDAWDLGGPNFKLVCTPSDVAYWGPDATEQARATVVRPTWREDTE